MAHGTFSRTGFLTSRTTGILALSNAIVMFGFGQILPLVPLLLYNVLGASELEVGLAITSFAVTRVVFQGAFGGLSDRFGRKPFVVFPLLGYGVASLLYVFSSTTVEIIAIRALQGVFSASLWPVSDAIVMDSVEPRDRGKAIATIQNAYTTGWILGPFIGGVLAGLYGFSAPFIASAAMAFVAAGLGVLFLEETRTNRGRGDFIEGEERNNRVSLRELFPIHDVKRILGSYPVLRRLAVLGFLMQLAPVMIFPFLSIFITEVLDGTILDVGLVIGILGMTAIVAQLSSGVMGDRFGKWLVLGVSTVLATAAAPLLLFITDLPSVYILLPASMVVVTFGQPMLAALVGDIAKEEERGSTYGAFGVVRDSSMIVGPLLGGGMMQLFSLLFGTGIAINIYYLFGFRILVLAVAAAVAYRSLSALRQVDTAARREPHAVEEHSA